MASSKRRPAPLLSFSQIRVERKVAGAKNALLIVGLPGIGLVSKLAVDNLAAQAKATRVATLFSPHFPNQVLALKTGKLKTFNLKLDHAKIKKRDVFFLRGDLQPLTVEGQYEVASKVLSYFKRKCGGADVIAMAGYAVNGKKDKPALYAATTSQKLLKDLQKTGAKTLPHPIPIVGLGGLVPSLAPLYGLRGACVLVETSGSPIDANGGAALLDFLGAFLNAKFDSKELYKQAKQAEALAAKIQAQSGNQPPAGGAVDAPVSGAVDAASRQDVTRYIR